jgi:hypothetical protein
MVKEKMILTTLQRKANRCIKDGESDDARDTCDKAIAYISEKKYQGHWTGKTIIESTSINTWLMRFWVTLENNNLMLPENQEI